VVTGDPWAAFVTARLDGEEREANREAESLARFEKRPGDWTRFMCDPVLGPFGGQSPARDIATGLYVGKLTDPHRVLREVAAKRALVAAYEASMRSVGPGLSVSLLRLVQAAAEVWIDHPDYAALTAAPA